MKARYDEIYHDIRRNIEAGAYAYQSYLPSEAVLTSMYTCSHSTVRRAIAVLRDNGYVQPVHGKGVRVTYREPERESFSVGGIESFDEVRRRSGFSSSTRVIAFERMPATQTIADYTGFALGDDLFIIERVRTIDGEALILDRNFFLASAAEGLTPEIAETSIYSYLEKTLGVTIAMSKREITGERATDRDNELLDLDDVDYLAVVKSQTFDAQGTMIEYTQSRHRLDHFCFRSTAVRQGV